MAEIMKKNEDILKTHKRYDTFTSDEEKRMLYEARLKKKWDYNPGYGDGDGQEDGELVGKKKVLIRLLNRKFGLPEDEKEFIIAVEDPEKLDAAIDEIITAESLEDVLSLLK